MAKKTSKKNLDFFDISIFFFLKPLVDTVHHDYMSEYITCTKPNVFMVVFIAMMQRSGLLTSVSKTIVMRSLCRLSYEPVQLVSDLIDKDTWN